MAVKETITLEGAEQVKKAWQDIGQAGEGALTQLRQAGLNYGNVVVKFSSDSDRATGSIRGQTGALGGLRGVLSVLNPIIRRAGGAVGELGAFSRLAQVGVIGLAASITGTLLIALSKLADNSNLAKNRLEELLQSKDLGSQAFETLDAGARKLGTSTGNLVPVFEAARNALQSIGSANKFIGDFPQAATSVQNLSQSVADLFAIVRRSTGDSQKASQALVTFFDAIRRDGIITRDSLDQLRKSSPGAVNAIAQAFSLGKVSADDWLKSVAQAPVRLNDLFARLQLFKSLNPEAFRIEPVTAFGSALERLGRRLDDIVRTFTGGDINQLAAFLTNAFTNGLTIITNAIITAKDAVVGFFKSIPLAALSEWDAVKVIFSTNPFPDVSEFFRQAMDRVVSLAQSAWSRIKQIFSEPLNIIADFLTGGGPSSSDSEGDSVGAFATGGLFRGKPGRDTNLAWLSDNEFVMRPEAVRRYGVGLMQMINGLRLPIDQLRGFAMGGLVEGLARPSIPAFAAGGLNINNIGGPSGRPFNLVIGGETFSGLSAPDEVAERLLRFGRARNRASAGKAPSRVGRR